MSEVRPFRLADAQQVADVSHRVFGLSTDPAPRALAAYFAEAFLEHPWRDEELPSLVYVAGDGVVRGFLGVIPLRMKFGDRSVRVAVAASMMVEDAEADPPAGARLLRTFLAGPQDLSIGENAKPAVRRMWLPLGGRSLAVNGLEFTRILRPAGLAAHVLSGRFAPLGFAKGVAGAFDPMMARLARLPMPAPAQGVSGADVAPEDLAPVVMDAVAAFPLRPDFDVPTLRWLLSHAARKAEHGEPVARIVRDRAGRTVGGYLAHHLPKGPLRLMQLFAPPRRVEQVLDDLIGHAASLGAVSVTGRGRPELIDALQLRGCMFRFGGFTMVHSRSPEILGAVLGGDGFVGGLAGEVWARLTGDRFD